MTTTTSSLAAPRRSATPDSAHSGDIRGALGTISSDDTAPRSGLSARLKTLLAIVGPGLIVMVGDNDAGAFSTYGQAGQAYGTRLLWTFLLLVPVIYVNQEMVLRLGAVTGTGFAKLIIERFGRFWGVFSVVDLFILNALTIVTEFIGITLAASYLGLPKIVAVVLAGLVIVLAASTGSFRRFERIAVTFCLGSLLLIPLYVLAHPPVGQMARGFAVPAIPGGSGGMGTVMLLIIGIVGTTVAPWQLFFQQSYIIDKRITPRFMRYEKVDLWIGIVVVVIGGAALMGATAAAFAGTRHATFSDASGLAAGISAYAGHAAGALFAVALLDASMLGAFAVSLSTAYAVGDMLGLKHSLHRGVRQAKGFYAMYAAMIAVAATVVLLPGSPLGLLTEGVQVLAGVLLPSLTVFLLLLCNDREVLGPWVNGRAANVFASIVVGALVMLSVILTVSVLFGGISTAQILAIMAAFAGAGVLAAAITAVRALLTRRGAHRVRAGGPAPLLAGDRGRHRQAAAGVARENWRMPQLAMLAPVRMSVARRIGMSAMWAYIGLAIVGVVVRVVQIALGH